MPSKKPTSPDTKRKIDDKLDRALEDTFPASDPVSFVEPSPEDEPNRVKDRKPESRRER
jgi:hypothetical protein